MSKVYKGILELFNEVDCRIQHGSNDNGHLNYVRSKLAKVLTHLQKEMEDYNE